MDALPHLPEGIHFEKVIHGDARLAVYRYTSNEFGVYLNLQQVPQVSANKTFGTNGGATQQKQDGSGELQGREKV